MQIGSRQMRTLSYDKGLFSKYDALEIGCDLVLFLRNSSNPWELGNVPVGQNTQEKEERKGATDAYLCLPI